MASPNLPDAALDAQTFTESKFGSQAVLRLRAAFERSRHPMLIADDQRRWITGNAAACDLLGSLGRRSPGARWTISRLRASVGDSRSNGRRS